MVDRQRVSRPTNVSFFLFSRLVTFDWLKSSAKVGEWLSVNAFEPKRFFLSNRSANLLRKSRQQHKPIELFRHIGPIYLTSLADQRSLLLKLLTLLAGNVSERDKGNVQDLSSASDHHQSESSEDHRWTLVEAFADRHRSTSERAMGDW